MSNRTKALEATVKILVFYICVAPSKSSLIGQSAAKAEGSLALNDGQRLPGGLIIGVDAQRRFQLGLRFFDVAQAQQAHAQNGVQRGIVSAVGQRLTVVNHSLFEVAGVARASPQRMRIFANPSIVLGSPGTLGKHLLELHGGRFPLAGQRIHAGQIEPGVGVVRVDLQGAQQLCPRLCRGLSRENSATPSSVAKTTLPGCPFQAAKK